MSSWRGFTHSHRHSTFSLHARCVLRTADQGGGTEEWKLEEREEVAAHAELSSHDKLLIGPLQTSVWSDDCAAAKKGALSWWTRYHLRPPQGLVVSAAQNGSKYKECKA